MPNPTEQSWQFSNQEAKRQQRPSAICSLTGTLTFSQNIVSCHESSKSVTRGQRSCLLTRSRKHGICRQLRTLPDQSHAGRHALHRTSFRGSPLAKPCLRSMEAPLGDLGCQGSLHRTKNAHCSSRVRTKGHQVSMSARGITPWLSIGRLLYMYIYIYIDKGLLCARNLLKCYTCNAVKAATPPWQSLAVLPCEGCPQPWDTQQLVHTDSGNPKTRQSSLAGSAPIWPFSLASSLV